MKFFFRLIFLLSIICFLFVGAYRLTWLGVPVDTSAFIVMADQIANMIEHRFFNEYFPVMETFYSGWTLSYLFAAVMLLGGKSLFSYLFLQVVIVAVSLCAMVRVLSRWFNFYVATVVCLLLVSDINFVRASKYACEALEIMIFAFFWIALALFQFGFERRRLGFFAAGAFVCGFGCWIKLSFFCYLVPLALLLAVTPSRIRSSWFGNTLELKKLLPVVCGFFLLAFSPVIYDNIFYGAISINGIVRSVIEPSHLYNNLNVLSNLADRVMHFIFLLRGSLELDGTAVSFNNLYPWMFLVCAVFLTAHMIFAEKPVFPARNVGLIALFYIGVLLTLCYVPSMPRVDHILLLYPFSELVCALAFYCAVVWIRPVAVPSVLVALLLGTHLSINIGRGISFFENMQLRLVPGHNCVPDVFASRQIRGKCRGIVYFPTYMDVYLMDVESISFDLWEKDPLYEADTLFHSHTVRQKEFSLLVSCIAQQQLFKQRLLQLSREAGYIIEERMTIKNKEPKDSYQFYNVYLPVAQDTD